METDKNVFSLGALLPWQLSQVARRTAMEVLSREPRRVIDTLSVRSVEWCHDRSTVIYHMSGETAEVFEAFVYLRRHREADLKNFFSVVATLEIAGRKLGVLGIDDLATTDKTLTVAYGVDLVTIGSLTWECGGPYAYSLIHKYK